MDNHGGRHHKKTDVHITLDQDVLQELARLDVVRSRFINSLLRTALFGEEPSITVKLLLERRTGGLWCPGRDLNPGRGLERPACLTGLHHRGSILGEEERLKTFRSSVNAHQNAPHYYEAHPHPPEDMDGFPEINRGEDYGHYISEVQERIHKARRELREREQPKD